MAEEFISRTRPRTWEPKTWTRTGIWGPKTRTRTRTQLCPRGWGQILEDTSHQWTRCPKPVLVSHFVHALSVQHLVLLFF